MWNLDLMISPPQHTNMQENVLQKGEEATWIMEFGKAEWFSPGLNSLKSGSFWL